MLYALASSVICKGDNKRWQPNYSSIIGSLAAGVSRIFTMLPATAMEPD